MNIPLFILGLFMVLLSLVDALWTALWVDGGAGPITAQVTKGIWWIVRKAVPAKRHYWLSLTGPLLQVIIVLVWISLLWIGWVLIFSADAASLIYTRTPEPQPSTLANRIYFVAYTISTMGNGDLYPVRGAWEIVASFTSLSGMFLITMVVSFLLSVIGGVTNKQALASQISGLGHSSEDFILNTWDGNGFPGLNLQLISILSQLGILTEQHLAYPVLHRYHSSSPQQDSAPAVAILDDALTIFEYGLQEPYRPAPTLLRSARKTVQTYLKTLSSASIHPADQLPPSPDLRPLRQAGIPVVSDQEFAHSLNNLTHRRQLLLGLVEDNKFKWPRF